MSGRYRRKNQNLFLKEFSRAYALAKGAGTPRSEPSSPMPEEAQPYRRVREVMFREEPSAAPSGNNGEMKTKKKRLKPLSLNDNLHSS